MEKSFISSVKEELSLKKIIIILILIATLVFVVMQKSNFQYAVSYFKGEKVEKITSEEKKQYIVDGIPVLEDSVKDDLLRYRLNKAPLGKVSMKGSHVVTQDFVAEDNYIKQIRVFFLNLSNYTAKGKIVISVLDSKEKQICKAELDAGLIQNGAVTAFDFVENSEDLNANKNINQKYKVQKTEGVEIEKDTTYTLKIETKNVTSKEEFALCLCDEKYDDDVIKVDGKDVKGKSAFFAVNYVHTTYSVFILFILGILFAILLILLPVGRFSRKRSAKKGKETDLNIILLRILFVLTPFFCFWLSFKIAGLNSTEVILRLFTFQGLLNLLIILMIWMVIYTLCNRTKYTIIFTTLIFAIFAVANYMLLLFRNSPLVATDFASIGTAMDVAANYTLVFNKACLWVIVSAVIYICLAISLRSYKGLTLKKRVALLLAACAYCGVFYYTFYVSDFIEENHLTVSGFRPVWHYNRRGYVLAFTISTTTVTIKKPDGYSVENVEKVAEGYKSDKAVKAKNVSEKTPNVFVVMNESFSDLQAIGKFDTSSDYMPFVHSIKENAVTGTMHPSVLGGSTADSEFEFLTGNTIAFMPFHIVPYNNYIKDKMPSLTQTLKDQGYNGNISFHPGMKDSYNRNNVYPLLGFDKFISLEDIGDDYEKMRSFVSDKADFKIVIDEYEKYKKKGNKAPYYFFNVTIQNHGGYKISEGLVEKKVTITDSAVYEEQAEQYINLVKASDDAIKYFFEYFKNVDEPTVIVLFGDHQPRVGSSFYKVLNERFNSKETSLQRTERMYRVPFVIWANYDIKEQSGINISANYMSSYLLDTINAKMTGYNKYLLDLYKELPVISAICNIDKDGEMYDNDNKETKWKDTLNQYNQVEYNNVVDTENRVDDFFYLEK